MACMEMLFLDENGDFNREVEEYDFCVGVSLNVVCGA